MKAWNFLFLFLIFACAVSLWWLPLVGVQPDAYWEKNYGVFTAVLVALMMIGNYLFTFLWKKRG